MIPVSPFYTIPYLVFISFLWLLFKNEEGSLKAMSPLWSIRTAFVVAVLFLGGNYFMRSDWTDYYPLFEALPTSSEIDIFSYRITDMAYQRYEIGYVIYAALLKAIWADYFFIQFVTITIQIIALFYTFRRYSASAILPFIIWSAIWGISLAIDQPRSQLAISIFLFSIPCIENRKILSYFLLICLAYSFHHLSLVFIPIYFLAFRQIPLLWMRVLFIMGSVIYFSVIAFDINFDTFLNTHDALKAESYLANSHGVSVPWFAKTVNYVLCVTSFFSLVYCVKHGSRQVRDILLYNCCLLSIILFLFFSFSFYLSQRLSVVFLFAQAMCIARMYFLLRRNNNKHLISTFVLLLCLFFTMTRTKSIIDQYDNILFSTKSRTEAQNASIKRILVATGNHWILSRLGSFTVK